MKRILFFLLFFTAAQKISAQSKKDSCTMEISLLTCSPGTDLYSIFGHTAIRVRDTARGMDIVYNYGTFDDRDPLFYVHFTKGIMNYSLSAETMDSFMQEYQYEHRNVFAQVLDLSCAGKEKLFDALKNNTLEENRFYQYHFHTDNCTTRAARIIEDNSGSLLTYKNILPVPGPSFRDMIHEYLDKQHADWSAFGIDMLLGARLDLKPDNVQAIHFLPDYLYRGMENAVIGNKAAVREKQKLLQFQLTSDFAFELTPKVLFECLLLLFIVFFIFRKKTAIVSATLIFDILFFTMLGLFGLLITVLWTIRIDDVCRDNINILWALPTHIVAVFFIRKNKNWVKYYFLITAIIASILAIGFLWWSQKMNAAVFPILCIIVLRGFLLFQNKNHAEKNSVRRQTA